MKNQWFVFDGIEETGPYRAAQIVKMSRSGEILPTQLVRRGDSSERRPASTVRGMAFPNRAEDERLANAYVALAQRISSAISTASSDRRNAVADKVEGEGADPKVADAIRIGIADDIQSLTLCCLGHDLIYWAINAILADGDVGAEELEAVEALVRRISQEYAVRFERYKRFASEFSTDNFLAVFKKDKSHYGWPTRQSVGRVSTDVIVGGNLALAAVHCDARSDCLKKYAELIQATIHVTVLADGEVTHQEQAIVAQAHDYIEYLDKLIANHDEPTNAVISLEETVDEPMIETTASSDPDFRKISWGMAQDEVSACETLPPLDQADDVLLYRAEVAGVSMNLLYNFVGKLCYGGTYLSREVYTNLNSHLDDFDRIAELLISKYGKPANDETRWRDRLYASKPSRYGFAVSLGHLVLAKTWQIGDTKIRLALTGKNYSVTLGVLYTSERYGRINETAAKERDLDML